MSGHDALLVSLVVGQILTAWMGVSLQTRLTRARETTNVGLEAIRNLQDRVDYLEAEIVYSKAGLPNPRTRP